MPNIQDAFPSKFLKASDLAGAEPVVTMDHVAFEPVGRDKEMKAVLYFVGKEKGLVLNKTNANKITELAKSGITEEWEGQKIRLYATETNFGGETVDCIRVKAAVKLAPNGRPIQRPVAPPPPPVEVGGDHDIEDETIPF